MKRIVVLWGIGLVAQGCIQCKPAAKIAEPCLINSDCSPGLACVFRVCHLPCKVDSDCDPSSRCVAATDPAKTLICILPSDVPDAGCRYTSQCPSGLVCGRDEVCRNECLATVDCIPDQQCVSGLCAKQTELLRDGGLPLVSQDVSNEGQHCAYGRDCTDPLICREHTCVRECLDSRDCPLGATCTSAGRCASTGSNGGGGGSTGGGTGGGGVATGGGMQQQGGLFTLGFSPLTLAIGQGRTGNVAVSLRRTGEVGAVVFSAPTPPPGVTVDFVPVTTTASSVLMTVVVAANAAVGQRSFDVVGTGATGTSTSTIQLTIRPPDAVLLVDDDGSPNNRGQLQDSSFSDNLFANLAGPDADVYVVSDGADGPTLEYVKNYQTIVWYTGDLTSDTLHSADEAVLRAFLDQGGRKVVIFSKRYPLGGSWTTASGTWVTSYLGLKGIATTVADGSSFDVTGAGPMAGILMTVGAAPPLGVKAQGLNPAVGTDALLTSPFNPDGSGTVEVPIAIGRKNVGVAGTSATIVFSFPFENLTDLAPPRTKLTIFERLRAY